MRVSEFVCVFVRIGTWNLYIHILHRLNYQSIRTRVVRDVGQFKLSRDSVCGPVSTIN